MKRAILFLSILLAPTMASAVILNFEGFESSATIGGVTTGTQNSVWWLSTSHPKSGTMCFRTLGAGSFALRVFGTNGKIVNGAANPAYAGGWVYFDTLPPSGAVAERVSSITNTNGLDRLMVKVSSAGALSLVTYLNVVLGQTADSTVTTGTWYYLQYKRTLGAGAYELKLDGTTLLSGTAEDLDVGNSFSVIWGQHAVAANAISLYFDDVVWASTNYASATAKTGILKANGDGLINQWTVGTNASDWNEVDELPPDGATTVMKCDANGEYFDVALENSSTITDLGTIASVRALRDCSETTSGTSSVQMRTVSGVTVSSGVAVDAGNTAFIGFGNLMNSDPNTSSAWTSSGLDGLSIGQIGATCLTVNLRCTTIWADVRYEPAAPGGRTRRQMVTM